MASYNFLRFMSNKVIQRSLICLYFALFFGKNDFSNYAKKQRVWSKNTRISGVNRFFERIF
jgi:hypothetical protein